MIYYKMVTIRTDLPCTGSIDINNIDRVRNSLRHSIHPKLYPQAGFQCSPFCAQTSCRKFKIYINMCANEYAPFFTDIYKSKTKKNHKCQKMFIVGSKIVKTFEKLYHA